MATVRELAVLVGGEVQGDGDRVIHAARPLREAREGDITFIGADRTKSLPTAAAAGAVVVSGTVTVAGPVAIRVADPFAAFVTIATYLHNRSEPAPLGIDPQAEVDPSVSIGDGASVHPFAVIRAGAVIGARCRIHSGAIVGRDCRLGDDVTLHPHAVLYDGTLIGNGVIIHANAVVGADGFGYRFQNGQHGKVPQLGWVEIGDHVEVGACTTIDRGTFGPTRIGEGTKIDNLVMIAHNCQLGRHNVLAGLVGMAGSSSTGDYVMIAGQAGIADHVNLGDKCMIGAQTGVFRDVPAGQRMLGTPATQEWKQNRIRVALADLPELRRTVRRIMQHLGLTDDETQAGRNDEGMTAA